ncbi:MAG TPA: site-2 protease family protein [Gemmataceae bacterium]
MDNQQAPDRPDDVKPVDDSVEENVSLGTWLSSNLTWLIIGVAGLGALTYVMGPEGVWTIFKVALGLSLIIFVHELGHFAVAKLCDVHVQTFSIGFGPALPGCKFRWGETLYKLAIFPLGGYVKMVGEGDGDEGDEDPRSFKNKSVGQRMAIISAGVIMNVLLACVFFIIAYEGGVERLAGVVGGTDPGSPAWKKGVRGGMLVQQIGNVPDPTFEDLMEGVVLSDQGRSILLVGCEPDGQPHRYEIEPRREPTDKLPVIGVGAAYTTKLWPPQSSKARSMPAFYGSPAAAARELNLRPGDRLIAATDPDKNYEMSDLPADGPAAFAEFARRLSRLIDKPVNVRVESADGKKEERELPAGVFQFDDEIIGTTDASPGNQPYDPYRLSDLPKDLFRDPDGKTYNYFEYSNRLHRLAGKPVVLRIRRAHAKDPTTEHLAFVPPAYHYVLPGVRMGMGRVTALREGSPGEKAGVQPKDILHAVELVDKKTNERVRFASGSEAGAKELDPLRLPSDLSRWAAGRNEVEAILTVRRVIEHEEEAHAALPPVAWDASWEFDKEVPRSHSSPVAIPQLGIAYQVATTIERVAEDSPVRESKDKEGLRKDDVILEVAFLEASKAGADPQWSKAVAKLWTEQKTDKEQPEPWWARVDESFQNLDFHKIKVKLKRDNLELELPLEPDPSWPTDDLGLLMIQQSRLKKATSLTNAVALGMKETYSKIVTAYLSMKSIFTGRVSFLDNVQGPIGIAVIGYTVAGHDLDAFLLLLGFISINLAVVNFLPIPVLDGGHMVFLIYEKLRGKPASEQVRTYATFAGLALILSLMLLVMFLDVKKLAFWL